MRTPYMDIEEGPSRQMNEDPEEGAAEESKKLKRKVLRLKEELSKFTLDRFSIPPNLGYTCTK